MPDLAAKYGVPPEVMQFVDDGSLELLREDESKKTITFHMPSLRYTNEKRRTTTFTLTWIHPGFNEQFCHYYNEQPGDAENFYIRCDTDDVGDELLDVGESLEDLEYWVAEHLLDRD